MPSMLLRNWRRSKLGREKSDKPEAMEIAPDTQDIKCTLDFNKMNNFHEYFYKEILYRILLSVSPISFSHPI